MSDFTFDITKAAREKIYVKVALMSPSGGGKTWSALTMATGMLNKLKELGLEKNGKILFANTEASRGRYYANEFDYDIVDVAAAHHPDKYVALINTAVEKEYPILIIDSSSHEWEGRGGCLELHQQFGGTYQAWARVTPLHDKFITTLADAPIHIIATMRGKDAYEIEKTDSGKISVKKLGVGAKQREGFEYEFTTTFLIDQQTHIAEPQKDNTHLFENQGALLRQSDGEKLIEWANSGEGYTIPVRETKSLSDEILEVQNVIIDKCSVLGGSGNANLMKVLKKHQPAGNPKKLKDLKKLKAMLADVEKLIPESTETDGEDGEE